ncbi:MAG: hypothetical protein HZB26_22885 [Candidatus Hydrogenedentes bacterium]|nr:hypothetical protein [Candidatus Hydrogenedentota bacterium]
MKTRLPLALLLVSSGLLATAEEAAVIPDDFPKFIVPGHEHEMDALRGLYWHHIQDSGPKATLWDDWLTSPTLWPAMTTRNAMQYFREQWSAALAARVIDPEGYVATHQHTSIAHQLGWPFPFWAQGKGGWGWHFSLKGISRDWTGTDEKTQEGWKIDSGEDGGVHDLAWHVKLTAPQTRVTAPALRIDPYNAPFLQLRWSAKGLGAAQPYVEWTTEAAPQYGPERRQYFAPIETDQIQFTMIPVYRHPEWKGVITGLRVSFDNAQPGGEAAIQALFTQYDTRHNINSQNYVRGCVKYFQWTRDVNFLRGQINRMRTAMRYVMTEFHSGDQNVVVTRWVGHEGQSGLNLGPDGSKTILSGRGVGNNYWDLLPMGNKDAYATIHYYDALHYMAAIERDILAHPEWDIPRGVLAFDPNELEAHAARVKKTGNKLFWNAKTQRFACAVDVDGVAHDYGFTFLNLEAVTYGFATPPHAAAIMKWINGDRLVKGDTAQGADIYHWRFGPRSTTKRNVDYYFWAWSGPETIPWGGQVQDGGAVLGFSYHDLMARLAVLGPDNTAARLKEICAWLDEVNAVGGYRNYYNGTREGTMQGAGTAGGLGLDKEFFESILVPQIMFDGFLGFRPTSEGFAINPNLPRDWPELTITRIHIHDAVLTIRATHSAIEITVDEVQHDRGEPCVITLPGGAWQGNAARWDAPNRASIVLSKGLNLRFEKAGQ